MSSRENEVRDDEESPYKYDSDEDSTEGLCEEEEEGAKWEARSDHGRAHVLALVDTNCCAARCMKGKEALLKLFFDPPNRMTKQEVKASLLSVLSACAKVSTGKRTRSKGERWRFDYVVPIVGSVCRAAFASCYGIGDATLVWYRRRANKNEISVDPHKGLKNSNAAQVDRGPLVEWFSDFANSAGEATPPRRRRREAKDGGYSVKYETEQYTLLPAACTWEQLHYRYLLFYKTVHTELYHTAKSHAQRAASLEEDKPKESCKEFSPVSFSMLVKTLNEDFPLVKIRSQRDNVCDVCSIYKHQAPQAVDARRLQHSLAQPSAWYFLSLISMPLFEIMTNFIYSERVGNKDPNEIFSILERYLRMKKLVSNKANLGTKVMLYADSCSGQNKNDFLIKFLLMLTEAELLKEVNYKFFIKGHTKNACDRGFGVVKQKYNREESWIFNHIIEHVSASKSNETVPLCTDLALGAAEGPSEMSAGLAWSEEAVDGEEPRSCARETKRRRRRRWRWRGA